MRSSRLFFLTVLLVILIAEIGIFVILRPHSRELLSAKYWNSLLTMGEVMRVVHRNFVNDSAVDYDELATHAMRAMMDELDEYSQYMDTETYQQFTIDSDQQYVGIGVEIQRIDFRVTLGEIFAGSPAGEAGMQSGDQIIAVDGENTELFSVSEMSTVLRGKEGAEVTVKVYRPAEDREYTFTFARKRIDFPSIRKTDLSADSWQLGYVRLAQFGSRSATELEEALNRMEAAGMRGLVLDLRNNPGGILPIAVAITGQFIEDGELVVTTRGRNEQNITRAVAENDGEIRDFPIVILINQHSASASEIVAGALQDHRRAVIVGQESVGKGTVQTIYTLDDDLGLRITTAKYYLPSGRTIHKQGVKPDIMVAISASDQLKLFTQHNHLRYLNDQAFEKRFGFQPIKDAQLEAAYEILRGVLATRVVSNQ